MAYIPLVTYALQSKGPVISGLMLDNGTALLSEILKQKGYDAKVYDYNSVDSVKEIRDAGKEEFLQNVIEHHDREIKEKDVKLFGFKTYINGFRDVIYITNELKKRNPDTKFVFGGPLVSYFLGKIYDATDAPDFLIRGQADMALPLLVEHLYSGKGSPEEIPNLILPGSPVRREFPSIREDISPAYDDPDYFSGGKILMPVIEDSRGCSYSKCKFCTHPSIMGKFRQKSYESLINEILGNNRKYGFKFFRLSGSMPSSELMNFLADNLDEKFKISAFGTTDGKYNFEKIAKNVMGLFIGLESAHPDILEFLGKGKQSENYLDDVRHAIEKCNEYGIPSVVSVISPVPFETREMTKRTVDFVKEINPDFVTALPLGPLPGSLFYKLAKKGKLEGIELDPDFDMKFMFYDLDLLQDPKSWPLPPWKIFADGKWLENPFSYTANIIEPLMDAGIPQLSDELVLMAYLYNNGLSSDKEERRKQCSDFHVLTRKALAGQDAETLESIVAQINRNQLLQE